MKEAQYISKKTIVSDVSDFESLKKDGIALLHELCGETWTDFNKHDPGVTFLEQICYGLTDLAYRSEFDVADYLTGKDGRIDFNKQALYLPQEVFPVRPVTFSDFRKMMIDSVPEIENIWFRPLSGPGELPGGLCRIFIDLKKVEDKDSIASAVEKVKKIYSSNRNLAEDLHAVEIIRHCAYTLHGDIEINKKKGPASILSEIYFKCSKYIKPGVYFHPFEEMINKGMTMDEVFSGPLTRQGYIDEKELEGDFNTVDIVGLMGAISDVDGISHIKGLWFENDVGKRTESIEYEASLESLPLLHFPMIENEVGIRLYKNNKKIKVSLEEVKVEFDRFASERGSKKHEGKGPGKLSTLPEGKYRDFSEYSSIQNLLPHIYGVNRYGLPDSALPERKAQAKQLKAYLLFFEQIMANFLANLDGIPRLFSYEQDLKQSYFHQYLNNDNVPDVEGLYKFDKEKTISQMARILSRYDNFGDRRNRVLDYLLGIYGEKFSQNSLRHFNYYDKEEEWEYKIACNKMLLLKNVVEIGAGRAQAFDYGEAYFNENNLSGLQKKVGLLLALKDVRGSLLTAVFTNKGIELLSRDEMDRPGKKINPFDMLNTKNMGVLGEAILQRGCQGDAYRIIPAIKSGEFRVMLKLDENNKWQYPATYATRKEAFLAANALRSLLVALNVDSEGFHIVEHILLRPFDSALRKKAVPEDFYSFRITVVFPSWTARFSDKGFRKLAEETISLNCPAHILPEIYWLDFKRMRDFEDIYDKWLLEKRNGPHGASEMDVLSGSIVKFILKCRKSVPDGKDIKADG